MLLAFLKGVHLSACAVSMYFFKGEIVSFFKLKAKDTCYYITSLTTIIYFLAVHLQKPSFDTHILR